MKVKLLNGTKCPERKRVDDAGWDLYLNEDVTFLPHTVVTVNTGVCAEIPKGYAGLLAIRSSVSKTGLIIQNPLIDNSYRGQLHAIIYNSTDKVISYQKNERICSLYCFPYLTEDLEVVDELSTTERGESWSGSSGR